jgi:hypothetical protein
MKRILFITAFTPSKFSAGQNFTANTLDDLAEECKVDLIYFKYGSQDYSSRHPNISVLRSIRANWFFKSIRAICFPFLHPFFTVRFSFPLLWYVLRMIRSHKYDLVYFDFSQVFLYSLFIRGPKKVLMSHDVIYQKFDRKGSLVQLWWASISERLILAQKDISILVFSKKDSDILRKRYNLRSSIVNFYIDQAVEEVDLEMLDHRPEFCFFGAWNRAENSDGLLWFIRHVIPLLPEQRFVIIGPGLTGEISRAIETFASIRYVGFLQNPYFTLAESSALVAPLFTGAGVECHTADDFVKAITHCNVTVEKKIAVRNAFRKSYTGRSVLAFIKDYVK